MESSGLEFLRYSALAKTSLSSFVIEVNGHSLNHLLEHLYSVPARGTWLIVSVFTFRRFVNIEFCRCNGYACEETLRTIALP